MTKVRGTILSIVNFVNSVSGSGLFMSIVSRHLVKYSKLIRMVLENNMYSRVWVGFYKYLKSK